MKYIIDSLKYIKNNIIILLPSLAVAIVAFGMVIDYPSAERVVLSFSDGRVTSEFYAWFAMLMPFNANGWVNVILSIVAYVALVLDVAFIHTMVDKHVRFGSRSFRSVLSGYTINFIYGLICMAVVIVALLVLFLIEAAIMATFALASAYVFVAGAAICVLMTLFFLFVAAHFYLWLPCAEVTGFRWGESLNYSYAKARQVRWKNFAALTLPLVAALAITILCGVFLGEAGAIVAGGISFGCAYLLIVVASYLSYADTEGIEREDLRKY